VAKFRNPKAVLLPGMTGRVRFVAGTRRGVVLVPQRALLDDAASKAVYIVDSANEAELRPVTLEGSYEGNAVVTGGLAGGERVIVGGVKQLRPGRRVAIGGHP
jgi:membrane fusion protein, multidrug efflux system